MLTRLNCVIKSYSRLSFKEKGVLGLKFFCMIGRGGSTLCCRSLTTHKRKQASLSTAARRAVYLDR